MWTHERNNEVHWDGEDEMYWEYFTINDENGNEVARCDDEKIARLIVTVPELLEALQTLVLTIDNGTQMDVMIAVDEARAAVAKALGE